MKTIKLYISIAMVLIAYASCTTKQSETITNAKDYESFFNTTNQTAIKNTQTKIKFWNSKIKEDSLQILALRSVAKEYEHLFSITGDIDYVLKSEQALKKSSEVAAIDKENYLLTLAQNYITQHQFQKADSVAKAAYEVNNNNISKMVLFDIAMELGKYKEAKEYLAAIQNPSDYNFLIRLAKWEDYKGNLDSTIRNMEKARAIAESGNKKNLKLWVYTNLADYYGHAGRIEDSYHYYLKALEIDSGNTYAMKGIAWIVYSFEKNPKEALRIVDAIMERTSNPDLYLFKAELAEYMGDQKQKEINLNLFLSKVANPAYGVMYHQHLATVLAEEYQSYSEALDYMQLELQNRPTPMTYDLMAYILHLKGEHPEALKIAMTHVKGQTYEPTALLHLAQIYKSNQLKDEMSKLVSELKESSYELGPVTSTIVAQL
ncbi:tetratricopeptide repeat protein [Aquimarina brevivitae]|uniref:Uncharacterized protein n=1 Tax=Aquimarina brevivitae TaxID=323412 RepID=A0A4Q7P0Y2_9FLAO|nr:hypothetical protein [Aquimarina brevivitae]RZS93355.1 hypothetical protein EV197_1933 [Aquimarina brevivitae]